MSKIIRFVQLMATPHGVYPIDDVVELDDARAEELVRQGIAVAVKDDRDEEPKVKDEQPVKHEETATLSMKDMEVAAKRTGKGK